MSNTTITTNTSFVLPKIGAGLQLISKSTSPPPTPQAHEVLVRIHAVSLNFRDYAMTIGNYPATVKQNLVLGSDMAGEIVQLGEGVSDWKVGERVTANFDQGLVYGPDSDHSELHLTHVSHILH